MSEVYFSKKIEKILDKLDYSKLGKNVAIKVHFGESGCTTHLNPELARKVYKKIESLGKKACLVECNVLYRGSRTNSKDHINTARAHGFTDMDIDILDGDKGQEYIEVDGCRIGKGIEKYDSMIVLSHFKGHIETGFGGAFKNIGMGLGSRAGKLDMHSSVSPFINRKKCTGCETCIKNCDVDAISLIDGKAEIDPKVCIGCAMCIAVCPVQAAQVPWEGRTATQVQKRVSEYAGAVIKQVKNLIYINVLENITPLCDCMGQKQKPIMEDIGILASSDIVAIDQASLDLVNQRSNNNFDKVNEINKQDQIEFAADLGIGTKKYSLIEL